MLNITENQLFKDRVSYKGIVNCPVDVTVYSDNEIVGEIKNNIVDKEKTEISMNVEGDSKTFYIPADGNYTIELSGNDDGEMDYSLVMIDADTGEVSREYYHKIPVKKDATVKYTQTTNADGLEKIDLKDSKGKIVEPTAELTGDALGKLSVNVTVIGSGTASGYKNLSPGDYVSMSAIPDNGGEFLGWFDKKGELLSSDNVCRIRCRIVAVICGI